MSEVDRDNAPWVHRDEFEEFGRNVYKRLEKIDVGLDKLGDRLVDRGSVNWGWVFAAIGVLGAVLTFSIQAFVNPLATRTTILGETLNLLAEGQRDDAEMTIRNDERWRLWLDENLVQELTK